MHTYTQCPACGSAQFQTVLEARDYTVSQDLFKIAHCPACTHRFTNPVPDEAAIGPYYKSDAYISHSDTQKGFINRVYQKVRNRALKSKRNLVQATAGKQRGTLLDIGCGTGYFLTTMKTAGWTVTGLEPDPDARQAASTRAGQEVLPADQLFAQTPAAFDVITMWHVLEHVHRLDDYLRQIHALLKDGGLFVVAVPNYQSLDADKYQAGWAAYDVPRHLYHFSPQSMEALLKRHGFKVEAHKRMPFDSFYVSMLSEKYRQGSMVRGIWIGFRSWLASLNNPRRCSSVIYLIRKTAS